MKYVYRIEHRVHKTGPYNTDGIDDPQFWEVVDQAGMQKPVITEDLIDRIPQHEFFENGWKCGFPSRKKMLEWFSGYCIKVMEKHGFVVRRYKPTAILHTRSGRQIAFI